MSTPQYAAPARWRQFILVHGQSLRRLVAATNVTVSDPNNPIVLQGIGEYFPALEGIDWAAGCFPLESQAPLGDISMVLNALVDSSAILLSHASHDEVEAWLRKIQKEDALVTAIGVAAAWELLRGQDCYRMNARGKVRIVWWPGVNIFPARTDFVRKVRAALPRRCPGAKQTLAAVRRLESCTLPWAPAFDVINAADNAMFELGDMYGIDSRIRRDVLIDVLHGLPADTTPRRATEAMRARFQALQGAPPAPLVAPQMTTKAGPHAYAEFIRAGWTDAQLIEHGYMV